MKRIRLLVLIATALVLGSSAPLSAQIKTLYTGLGFNGGMVVVDNPWPIDIGPYFNVNADIAFSLRKVGEIHYVPGFAMWFGADDVGEWDYFAMELQFNFADARYYPPVPASLAVKPYAGFAPSMVITIYNREFEPNGNDDTDVDADVGFNFCGGADFRLSPSTMLNAEIRGKTGRWDLAIFKFGATFVISGTR